MADDNGWVTIAINQMGPKSNYMYFLKQMKDIGK